MIRHIKSRAFTLIELLVVVAIIAVLIAVLMPALSNARLQAKQLACLTNMKQIGMGVQMYASENNSIIPSWIDDQFPNHPWLVKLMPMVQNRGELWVCPASPDKAVLNLALMHNAVDGKAVDDPTGNFYLQAFKSINIGINRQAFDRTNNRRARKLTELPNAGDLIYAADTAGYNTNFYNPRNAQGFITVIQSIYPTNQDSIYVRHGYSANVLFADGHAAGVPFETLKVWSAANTPIWYQHWYGTLN